MTLFKPSDTKTDVSQQKKMKDKKMKQTLKGILLDALKRYLPLIINALCAGACLTASGCVIARNANINILPKEVSK